MASSLRNLGLDYLVGGSEAIYKLLDLIENEGTIVGAYGSGYYSNMFFGDAHVIVRNIINEDEKTIEFRGLDAHSKSNCIWNLRVAPMGIINADLDDNTDCMCVFCKPEGKSGIVVVDVINANVLPSYLENDITKLQMVAFAESVHYYPNDDAYTEAQPVESDGNRHLLSDGLIMPYGYLYNHSEDRQDSKKDYSKDDLVLIKSTVKGVHQGCVEVGADITEGAYLRILIDTEYGPLEIVHTLDQIEESERENIKPGAVVTGLCTLTGNAAIEDYENGAVFDEEHNLRLLRHSFMSGNAARSEYAFTEDAKLYFESPENCYEGRDTILSFIYDNSNREDDLYAYIASIVSIKDDDETPPEYEVGKRCIALSNDEECDYEGIIFIDVNEKGKITTLSFSTDSRYDFVIDA